MLKCYHLYKINHYPLPIAMKVLQYNIDGSSAIVNIIITITVIYKGKYINSLLENIENLSNQSWTPRNSTKYIRLCITTYFFISLTKVSITYWIYSKENTLIKITEVFTHEIPIIRITTTTISMCFIMNETKKVFASLNSKLQSPHHFEAIINQKAIIKAFDSIYKINDIFGFVIASSALSYIVLILYLALTLYLKMYKTDVVNVAIWIVLVSFNGVSKIFFLIL